MKQTVCDICGKPVGNCYHELQIQEKQDFVVVSGVESIYKGRYLSYDLCDSCTRKLEEYLEELHRREYS